MNSSAPQSQRGTSLVEVLVTMVILAIGLLALAGLQARLHVLQIESYQRAQALIILRDMASRITNNRYAAADLRHRGAARHGCGMSHGHGHAAAGGRHRMVQRDHWRERNAWRRQRSAPWSAGGAVSEDLGARRVPGDGGLAGTGSHFRAARQRHLRPEQLQRRRGSQCINDLCRRVVTTVIRIPTLT